MRYLFSVLLFSLVYAATVPSLPECSSKILPDKSMSFECILAELSLHEVVREDNKNWLGIGNYVTLMRFYIKNPQIFSKVIIYKSVVGAVEECSIRNLFTFSTALLILQSPSPFPGGNRLKGLFGDCLKSILSEDLLDSLFDDMEFLVNKKSFSKRTLLN